MEYPTPEQVNSASHVQICEWWRFLPSPGTRAIGRPDFEEAMRREADVMDVIAARLKELGGITKHFFTPDETDKYRRTCARCGRDMTANVHYRSLDSPREEQHKAHQMKYANAATVAEVHELLDCVQADGTISGLDEFEHAEYGTLATVLRDVLTDLDHFQRCCEIKNGQCDCGATQL